MEVGCLCADILLELDFAACHEKIQMLGAVPIETTTGRRHLLQVQVVLGTVAATAVKLLSCKFSYDLKVFN